MPDMTLAFALYFTCPHCGQHIDVGESSEEVSHQHVKDLVGQRGMQRLEGTCPGCQARLVLPITALRSRARN
ncbi:MAG: hypothetical protein ACKVPX_01920 [Myxococcaceae bacterium]